MGDRLINFIIDHPVLFTIGVIIAASPLSYAMAMIGEPRAVWIWRDILGLI
jgi:hypothetical protein